MVGQQHIVICEKRYPFPPDHGRATRVVTLARALRELGFRVTLLVCSGRSETLPDGTQVRAIPISLWPLRELVLWFELRRINRGSYVDFFQVQNDVFVILAVLAKLSGFRIFYDAQVVERHYWSALCAKSFRELASSVIMPVCEGVICRVAERVSVLSEVDAGRIASLHRLPLGKVLVVPFSPRSPLPATSWTERLGARLSVLFLGSYAHRPNVDAIDLISREIRPRVHRSLPDTIFQIVGKELPAAALEAEGLEPHANVEDVTPLIDAATVCIAPVRVGSGVRTKLLEYMSRGKPVVAMTPALEGLHVTPGVHLLVADDYDSFADDVIALLTDPGLRRRIGTAGLERILELTRKELTEGALSALYSGVSTS